MNGDFDFERDAYIDAATLTDLREGDWRGRRCYNRQRRSTEPTEDFAPAENHLDRNGLLVQPEIAKEV